MVLTFPPQRYFLIGPMGAGKTTVGRRLAQSRGLPFMDVDHALEQRTGVDIPFIFEKEGEPGFREREAQLIDELSHQDRIVLATGGGAILREDTRARLAARGVVIYLHASVGQQLHRTARTTHRPLLQTGEPKRAILTRLFEQRDPLYREIADLIIETDGRNARSLVAEIDRRLQTPECSRA
jgi:shikimate kinase